MRLVLQNGVGVGWRLGKAKGGWRRTQAQGTAELARAQDARRCGGTSLRRRSTAAPAARAPPPPSAAWPGAGRACHAGPVGTAITPCHAHEVWAAPKATLKCSATACMAQDGTWSRPWSTTTLCTTASPPVMRHDRQGPGGLRAPARPAAGAFLAGRQRPPPWEAADHSKLPPCTLPHWPRPCRAPARRRRPRSDMGGALVQGPLRAGSTLRELLRVRTLRQPLLGPRSHTVRAAAQAPAWQRYQPWLRPGRALRAVPYLPGHRRPQSRPGRPPRMCSLHAHQHCHPGSGCWAVHWASRQAPQLEPRQCRTPGCPRRSRRATARVAAGGARPAHAEQ